MKWSFFPSQPNKTPEIEENKPTGTAVTEDIIAKDPDTTADLEFSIDWETTWATKQGRRVDTDKFEKYIFTYEFSQ